ncbi:hypothetical protein BDZ45DRAFT_581276 [Acephala macrosclerotiorum]|nr:hypothetical protein BDZ45DRAFT_581276 [Acephala macrosclerotiorum]
MLVSSKHLVLASPVFKAMFRSGFQECQILQSQGRVEVDLPDDDPAAFQILLNVIHGHVRKVPDEVNLETMTKLSILVDKYQVHEVVELYVRHWMPKLRESLPTSFTPNILPWISISWVFRLREDFKTVTRIAERESSSDLGKNSDVALPIPTTVLGSIDASRQQAISAIIKSLQSIISDYNTGAIKCRTNWTASTVEDGKLACDGMILGTLMKGLSGKGLWPLPKAPYEGISILKFSKQVRDLKILSLCDDGRFYGKSFSNPDLPAHGLTKRLTKEADKIEDGARGLHIHEFE